MRISLNSTRIIIDNYNGHIYGNPSLIVTKYTMDIDNKGRTNTKQIKKIVAVKFPDESSR